MMKVNVISRKLIKPCTPTPLHLNKYKISFIDELAGPINFNIILLYHDAPKTIITQLEESLANILPQFYPLAGRYLEKDHSVDCNDEGVEFVVAEATDLSMKMDEQPLNGLLPRQHYEADGPTDPLLSIQVTRLVERGELAISISVSHRIFDASSLATFISAWSNNTDTVVAASFDSPSLFPGKNLEHGFDRAMIMKPSDDIVMKRLVFSKEDIEKLRSKIIINYIGGEQKKKVFVISRVRLVTAFIAKAIMRMEHEKQGGCAFFLKIVLPVNMRARTIPPLPKHACGNLVVPSVTRLLCIGETNELVQVRFEDLVYMLGEAIGKTVGVIGETLALGKEGHQAIVDAVVDTSAGSIPLVITDWSKFRFYEADFGWGKPVFVGFGTSTLLYGTKLLAENRDGGGGIEAWVNVNGADLPCFERYVQLSQMETEDF